MAPPGCGLADSYAKSGGQGGLRVAPLIQSNRFDGQTKKAPRIGGA